MRVSSSFFERKKSENAPFILKFSPDVYKRQVKALLAELNRQKDKKGRPYHFALTTWDEEGIALPPDAA